MRTHCERFVLAGFIIFVVWFLFLLLTWGVNCADEGTGFGEMGDAFNMLNALFAGLAFVAIISQLWIQQEQIKAEREARQHAERISALTALSQMTYQKIIYERELLLQVAPGFRTVSFVRPGDAELTETAYEIRKSNVVSIQQLINLLNSPQTVGTIHSRDTRSLVEELSNNESSLPMLQEIQRLSTRLEKYEVKLESLLQEKA